MFRRVPQGCVVIGLRELSLNRGLPGGMTQATRVAMLSAGHRWQGIHNGGFCLALTRAGVSGRSVDPGSGRLYGPGLRQDTQGVPSGRLRGPLCFAECRLHLRAAVGRKDYIKDPPKRLRRRAVPEAETSTGDH